MEMLAAYYCFVNLGWPPSKFDALPYRERRLVQLFVLRELNSRKKEQEAAQANVKG